MVQKSLQYNTGTQKHTVQYKEHNTVQGSTLYPTQLATVHSATARMPVLMRICTC